MIDPDVLRDHVETDLNDDALDRLIQDAYTAIDDRIGSQGEHTYRTDGGGEYIFLDPPATTVSSVTENEVALLDGDEYDFSMRWDGRALRRVNGQWWGETIVEYEAGANEERTDRVVIDLCKLALQYEGLQSSSDGDYSETHLAYQAERNALIDELTSSNMGFA